ncbi:RagB/SusD family nutrient uptake outer membrane protein [Prolixibacteraceae bacterium JC049]|nr:RagB/SusD family nutrient uptake outer membrane protein [Prolixibacteraceae bacterium JC049]
MKPLKYITSAVLIASLGLGGCSDDFLKEAPLSTLSPDNTYIDAVGLKTPLDASLKAIFNLINGDGNGLMFDCATSDVSVIGVGDKSYAWQDCNVNATPFNGRNNEAVKNKWWYEETYKHLKNANTVIDYIDNPEWSETTERDHILGSAYFVRAFFYYLQTMHFGDCAFPLNVVTEAKQDFRAFTMESIWQQMIIDLEWAKEKVKPANQVAKGQVGNSAVRLLLSKFYLLTNQYEKAEAECDAILSSGVHALVTDADVEDGEMITLGMDKHPNSGKLFDGRTTVVTADAINKLHNNAAGGRLKNSEALLVFVNAPNLDATVSKSKSMRSYGPNFGNKKNPVLTPEKKKGVNSGSRKGEQMMKWGRGQGQMRPTNYSQYEIWNTNPDSDTKIDWQDYRHKKGNWFRMEDVVYDDAAAGDWYGKNLQLRNDAGDLLCNDTIRNWYGYPQYKFWNEDFNDPLRGDGGEASLYLLRLAEVYLLRAEARFWQGDHQGAADDINVIRERANAIYSYTAADVQRDGIGAVLDERARELYGEEFRGAELTRIAIILATSGKTAYNGKTYSMDNISEDSFWYDRMMEKNTFFKEGTLTTNGRNFTLSAHHIFWPIYHTIIDANVGAVLNQTPGYEGDKRKAALLVHQVQPAGVPNTDPMLTATEE